jgi:hypothetical protein
VDDLPNRSWSGILLAVGFAMQSTFHTTTQVTPAQLVFNCNAMHNVQFEVNWQYIKERKQCLIIQNNKCKNAKRVEHTYAIGDKVVIELDPNRKHGSNHYKGPYTVTNIYDNGTVRLQQRTQ